MESERAYPVCKGEFNNITLAKKKIEGELNNIMLLFRFFNEWFIFFFVQVLFVFWNVCYCNKVLYILLEVFANWRLSASQVNFKEPLLLLQKVKDSWRVINRRDIIPTIPRLMGYCHVAQPIYLATGYMESALVGSLL